VFRATAVCAAIRPVQRAAYVARAIGACYVQCNIGAKDVGLSY
jgi:hypothetical protein